MHNWAVIEANKITEYHETVPISWRHISNLAASAQDLEFMRSVNWFPVMPQAIQYDSDTHYIHDYEYSIGGSHVIATPILREKPPVTTPAPASDLDRPLMDLALLQTEINRWRDALSQQQIEKLAEYTLRANEILQLEIQRGVKEFLQTLPQNPDLMQAITSEQIQQTVNEKLDHEIDLVIGSGLTRRDTIKLWWHQVRQAAEDEIRRYASESHSNIFAEIETQRIMLKQMLTALNIDSMPKDPVDWMRFDRDIKLITTDWTQLPDVQANMDAETRQRWQRYRQALRDVPQVWQDKHVLEWPEF